MNRRAFLNPLYLFQTSVKVEQSPDKHLKVNSLDIESQAPTRFFLRSGSPPSNTITDSNERFDAVMYIDSADGRPKILTNDGKIYSMTQID